MTRSMDVTTFFDTIEEHGIDGALDQLKPQNIGITFGSLEGSGIPVDERIRLTTAYEGALQGDPLARKRLASLLSKYVIPR